VVATYRDQTEKRHLQEALVHAQRLDAVGRLAGGVAHDFNNMLSVILGNAEIALSQVESEDPLHGNLRDILDAAKRSADLTRQLLAFARKQAVTPKVLDLNDTIADTLKMLIRMIGENILLNWRPAPNLWPVNIDSSQISQILTNLCVNARDAIADIGQINIETGNCTVDADYCASHEGLEPGEYVRLTVKDNGRGMDKDTIGHIFEPFFTTKEFGKGTGLGLATVYGAVKQNNGFIDVESAVRVGTTITIYLPRYAENRVHLQAADGSSIRPGGETILLVEDEPGILKMVTAILKRHGYSVLAASTPGEAIHLATVHAGEIHLLMTDVIMPEMNGRNLAKSLQSLYPNLKCLFMSGYTADIVAHHGVLNEGVCFIQKPFSGKDLIKKLSDILGNE
jgi:two-component system cell cycle sensor histidine kinase/response regulator CckA